MAVNPASVWICVHIVYHKHKLCPSSALCNQTTTVFLTVSECDACVAVADTYTYMSRKTVLHHTIKALRRCLESGHFMSIWTFALLFRQCDILRRKINGLPSTKAFQTASACDFFFCMGDKHVQLLVDFSHSLFCILTKLSPQEYLQKFYGYQPKSERQKRSVDTGEDADWTTGLCEKVKTMQRFFGLPPNGELTKETLAVMKRPRCGLSDVERFGNTVRWTKKTLSYRFEMIGKKCRKENTGAFVSEKQRWPTRLNHTLKNIPFPLWGHALVKVKC